MVPIRELLYEIRDTLDQWFALRGADVHFDQTWIDPIKAWINANCPQ